ncbi:MAG: carboxypeptidase regulatory-like domain-containing protein, partial [Clostridia bacterium]|nr:carboxypeptidase regulatory-like domain-containing protein [Clostridia bacterium]
IVNARMAVESYLNNGVETPEPEIPTAGFVTGLIQDAKTENLIESAVVKLTHGETGDEVMAFVDRGTYYTWAPPGTYTMEFHAEGYQTETIYGVEITEGVVNYNILLNMVEEVDTVGQIYGRVVDAFDASSIPNANLTVYAGVNNTAGTPVATGTADAYGAYSFELSPGNYTVYASAEGYTPGTANLLVVGDETRYDQDCTLTPILENGEIRVVLTWNEFPYDLDSHLTGPSPYGDRFHVYYSSQNYYYNGEQYVNLDVDDINSYGPETTSVYIPVDGSYTFYVHNYSNRSASFSNDLATSGAKVTVYLAGRVNPYVFYVPNEEGTLWEVFTIENGTLRPTNEMSYQSSPSDVGL